MLAACSVAAAQCSNPAPKDFETWINCKVEEAAKARISQRENTKQTETPSVSQSSTSLVDQSSATDLISAALNLAGLRDNSGAQQKSFSFTASGYSLYATAKSHDPLDPAFYNAHAGWRRFWLTLGQEVPDQNEGDASQNERATIAGLKILLVDKRDLSHRDLSRVSNAIRSAAPGFLQIVDLVQNYLYNINQQRLGLMKRPSAQDIETDRTLRIRFAQELKRFSDASLSNPQAFEDLLIRLNSENVQFINRVIEDHLGAEVDSIEVVRQEVEKIRKAPQFSLAFQSKTRKEGIDEYKAELIFDYGLHSRVNLTLNGAFQYMDSKATGADIRAASASGQLQFQVTPERTFAGGRNPIYFYISGEGKWMSGMDATGKVQTKIKIPITEGIELPISFTWANRTELIDERDVRGQFGVTFDLARLAKAVGFK
ncbi:MAG TPA: hypothetical protein VJX74_19485 [Blastocatellia bacterium]|nr:hypothetical protein [Blastocatellia bacterium]